MTSNTFQAAFGDLKQSEFYEHPASTVSERVESAGTSAAGDGVSATAIRVNPCQKGNPLLRSITTVPWQLDSTVTLADYVLGRTTCALFLSLRYHQLNPDYLARRVHALNSDRAGGCRLRVLLVQVDVLEPHHILKQVTALCVRCRLTLMVAWSADEAGHMLDTYKAFEHKPATAIQPSATDANSVHVQACEALASVRLVNRTDAAVLLRTFGSMAELMAASERQVAACPGVGAGKAASFYRLLRTPVLTRHGPDPVVTPSNTSTNNDECVAAASAH